ncbi:MAG TPA: class II aldolase/adducin family protein [Steroidobacteraceae bacterium]|nr:class II aldolase/adducin family protein [Steroidobacteraceae bacterium]
MTNIMPSSPGTPASGPWSPDEQRVRVELAIAYRLFDWLGITDLIHTHISVCVPGEKERFLQLPYGHLFREARASNMVKCDVEGRIVSDPTGLGISKGGFCIHSAIHMGNPNAVCVMHAHTEATLAVASYRDGLLPLSQHALRFYGKVSYLDYCGTFETEAKRAELPRALGNNDVLMLRNHGPLVIGKSIRECFSRMYYLERACRMQVAALSQCRDIAKELVMPDERHCAAMARAFENGDAVIDREWNALVRMLKTVSPGFDE